MIFDNMIVEDTDQLSSRHVIVRDTTGRSIYALTVFHYENTPIPNILKFSPRKTESFQIKILILSKFLLKT